MTTAAHAVLVIDDEPQLRRLLHATLAAEGFRVIEAESARRGLIEAASHKPDLVILDLGLPDAEGHTVVRGIREWSSLPIVVLSARVDEQQKIAALDAGADDYVTKPFAVGELLARVRAALRRAARPDDIDRPLQLGRVTINLTQRTATGPHALVQDAAYETMVRRQREQVHRRIVEVFEHEFADQQAQHPEVFAHHCTEAGEWQKAIDARIRAARTARDRSAGIEAQAQVEAAVSLLTRIADGSVRRRLEGRLQVALADALVMTQGFACPGVMTALSKARVLLDATSDPVESIAALCGMSTQSTEGGRSVERLPGAGGSCVRTVRR